AFANFGELLRYLRRRAQLTQRDLAIAVGYSDTQISRLEQNQRLPDPATLAALFVPALGLEHAPEWVAPLLGLAAAARRAHSASPGEATTTARQPETVTHSLPQATQPLPISQTVPGPLLATKLYAPRARADLVPRPRLTARLAAGVRGPLTLITAPAGFGKTTLLAEWLDHQRLEARDLRPVGEAPSQTSNPQPHTPPH